MVVEGRRIRVVAQLFRSYLSTYVELVATSYSDQNKRATTLFRRVLINYGTVVENQR